jgi:chemotaxis regulatin CheY-phosphate phosphatase CheZ
MATIKKPAAKKPAAKPVAAKVVKPVAKLTKVSKAAPAARKAPAAKSPKDTKQVLAELKTLARELNKAAKGLGKKRGANDPKAVSAILGNVERMTAEAATKSLIEAESAKVALDNILASLGKDWSRKTIEASLKDISGNLTNIMVAQEFQDLAGQSIRQAIKALVGAMIVVEGGGPTADSRLSQNEVDSLLNDLMP